jgi:hypothetical protein
VDSLRVGDLGYYDAAFALGHALQHLDHVVIPGARRGRTPQVRFEWLQALFAGHHLGLVGENDDAFLIASGATAESVRVGARGLAPESFRV